jgi:hypothetical protein
MTMPTRGFPPKISRACGLEGGKVVLHQPIAGVLVRGGDSEVVAVECGEATRTEPGVESARGQSALEFGEHAVP